MKKYINEFISKEEGIETIEFVGLIAVAAVLIAVIVSIGTRMNESAQGAKDKIDNAMGQVDSLEVEG